MLAASLGWTRGGLSRPFSLQERGVAWEVEGLPVTVIFTIFGMTIKKKEQCTIKVLGHIVELRGCSLQLLSPSPFQFLNPESKAQKQKKKI
jgi:hypothetical protein